MSETSTVSVERLALSIADLGAQNPLPMVGAPLESPYDIRGELPAEIVDGATYGHPRSTFPYRLQDGYTRTLRQRGVETVVLENDRLRAVFIPELGGRLWELVDKTSGTQLLHSPGTAQFANLALRNAWFAGGIEWNIGTRGHSPTTCEPLHAGLTAGGRVLRMWEFERMRNVVFQIDAWLPDDSAVLFVAIRLRNPGAEDVPLYWWSNAAVPQRADTRVLAPATTAFATNDGNGISRVDPTHDLVQNGQGDTGVVDCTWPSRSPRARDFFFDLAPEQRRWILSADGNGDGLAMLSTAQLRGRKLFVWGNSRGGDRWQEWLTPGGDKYTEIQAGLTQTQFEHVRMPAGAEWSWLEAYGNARVDPGISHGSDWAAAIVHGEQRVDALLSDSSLQAAHAWIRDVADHPIERMVTTGSGWGALEAQRRRADGEAWIIGDGTSFPAESLTDEQQPWLDLLEGRGFHGAQSFVSGPQWEARLTAALETDIHHRAWILLQLAVMRHARGDHDEASDLYAAALEAEPVSGVAAAHAHRGLALCELALTSGPSPAGDHVAGVIEHYRSAWSLANADADPMAVHLASAILVEAATAFLDLGNPDAALQLLTEAKVLDHQGRLRFLYAQALARTGQPASAAQILREGIEIPDLREGKNSLASLWAEVCPGEAVPSQYQFDMG
ncbi:MAG: DUF5107 domain-containing protein [Rhodoglobus sp.]